MFVVSPPDPAAPPRDLRLLRAQHRTFTGPAGFLADPASRARVGEYLTDLAAPYGIEVPAGQFGDPPSAALGQSYSEMAEALIASIVRADEPVDLLVLAFSIHDLRPSQQAAAYLSHVTPGAPLAFAVCDQGSAAPFSALRIARSYAASAGVRRALVITVEQAALPYDCPVPLPARHQGAALLFGSDASPRPGVTDLRQHAGISREEVAALAAADLKELTADYDTTGLILGDSLAAIWTAPEAGRVRVTPPGQPATGVWSELADELGHDSGRPGLLVAADYDPALRCLSLAAFDTRIAGSGTPGA